MDRVIAVWLISFNVALIYKLELFRDKQWGKKYFIIGLLEKIGNEARQDLFSSVVSIYLHVKTSHWCICELVYHRVTVLLMVVKRREITKGERGKGKKSNKRHIEPLNPCGTGIHAHGFLYRWIMQRKTFSGSYSCTTIDDYKRLFIWQVGYTQHNEPFGTL